MINIFDEAILRLKDEMVRAICANLRFQSDAQPPEEGMPNGSGAAKSLEHALRTADQLGFVTKNVDGHFGWAECGQGTEMVAVLGHLDVVPAGDGWSFPPYAGMIDDGKIFGRGALDNKGPIFAALYGMKAVMDSGAPLKRRIRVVFGTSEETTFADMAHYVANDELPVAGFTPDADFPVIYAEKGILHVSFSREFTEMEKTDIKLESLKAGNAINMVPDKAEAVLNVGGRQVRLESSGVSAHGSTPQDGKNACFALLELLSHQDIPVVMQDAFSFLTYALTYETAGENLGITTSDEPSGSLSINLGLLEGSGDYIKGGLDIRYPVTVSKDWVLSTLEGAFAKHGFGIDAISHKPPLYVPKDDALVKTLMGVYQEKTGRYDEPVSTGGGTYARAMPNILAFGPLFPDDAYPFHKPDEYIDIDRLVLLSQIYAQAVYELAK
ncbi:MAG: Sapep family Mn(2+)-dependent dipeptidase [Peptococcaceae bacterium]|nr:Sapep family Mn(2+)-dependent dipeptidase [Peptococcaceae bacterium]